MLIFNQFFIIIIINEYNIDLDDTEVYTSIDVLTIYHIKALNSNIDQGET